MRGWLQKKQSNLANTMGIQGQASILWKSTAVPVDKVAILVWQRFSQHRKHFGQNDPRSRQRPRIGIDANFVGFKHIDSSLGPVAFLQAVICTFTRHDVNCDVVVICDGPNRHHSKRATIERKANRERQRISLIEVRNKLEQAQNTKSCFENEAGIAKLVQQVRHLERQQQRTLPRDFIPLIEAFVAGHNHSSPSEAARVTLETAPTQADPCLADLAVAGKIDAILSGDSDLSMYIGRDGFDGRADLTLLNPKAKPSANKGCSIVSFGLCTGQSVVADQVNSILRPTIGRDVFDREPKHPIFDGEYNPKVRALCAVALGCDALPQGIPGFGPAKIDKLLARAQEQVEDNLDEEEYCDKIAQAIAGHQNARVKDKDAIVCLANSLIFETTCGGRFIHGRPEVLEAYIKEFGSNTAWHIPVIKGPTMDICRGYAYDVRGAHKFLRAEGAYVCSSCQSTLCRFCIWDDKVPPMSYVCFGCKRDSMVKTST